MLRRHEYEVLNSAGIHRILGRMLEIPKSKQGRFKPTDLIIRDEQPQLSFRLQLVVVVQQGTPLRETTGRHGERGGRVSHRA